MIYEELTDVGDIVRISWRVEGYTNDEIAEQPELAQKLKLRFTRNVHNKLYHIVRHLNSDITISEMQILCKRVASLDTSFWLL